MSFTRASSRTGGGLAPPGAVELDAEDKPAGPNKLRWTPGSFDCHESIREGQVVERQRAWLSLL
eukprot:scaffold148200_cov18-Tisochrysis_lutea.AAC.1